MNHGIYRLVFNTERNAWVAVAENVPGRGKKSTRKRVAAAVLGAAVGFAAMDAAWAARAVDPSALPVPSTTRPFIFAGSLDGGRATTAMVNGINTMTVTTSDRLLGLNFDRFDVGSDAAFVLNQPDALSRALFRIWDSEPSQIYGKVTANGQLYLINQNGILFRAGSQVNIGGLVASALGMSETMMNRLMTYGLPSARGDSLTFSHEGSVADFAKGTVIVETDATINTKEGGKVVLIAPKSVVNQGNIGVEGGGSAETILATGGKVILTVPDDPNLRGILVETASFTGRDEFGINTTLDGTTTNAATGKVNMGVNGVVTLAGLIVNQQGIVNASKAVNLNGTTMLVSGVTDTDRLTINQRGSVAQIDWLSGFNVGLGKTVEFVQQNAGDVAYNYVFDPDKSLVDGSGSKLDNLAAGRSSIDGALKASGQLVLVNELGIDFGAHARVTANNFVASGLGMNPGIVSSGLLGQADVRSRAFYLNPVYPTYDSSDEAVGAADKEAALHQFRAATVNVEQGASIASASGGYVVLAGSRVNQGGSITTANGQTLLAAGADVYLKPAYSTVLRGFTAEVNPLMVQASGQSGLASLTILSREADANSVTNTGSISASFGNISMVGHRINQNGWLYSSTSTTANGSIELKARDLVLSDYILTPDSTNISDKDSVFEITRYFDANGVLADGVLVDVASSKVLKSTGFVLGKLGGTVSFGDGSVAQIAIDGSNGKTLTGSQSFIPSSVAVLAKKIVVGDADIVAKGGKVDFRSASEFSGAEAFVIDSFAPSNESAAQSDVGIFVADGAKIDVSGTRADKKVSELFVEVELRGEQFADNTVQRHGVLRGQKAWVDVRDAVEIANLSTHFNNIVGQTVEERAASGGTISLKSKGNVIVKSGATLDVSGGVVNYAADTVSESLVLAGRNTYRLNDAPEWASYSELVTTTRREEAYVEGKSAGTVEIRGNRLAIDGQLLARTTIGTKQRQVGDPATNRYAIPLGGQLIVQDGGQHYTVADRITASQAEKDEAYLKAQMVFVNGAANAASGLDQDSAGPDRLQLSSSLVDAGFSRFSLTSDGRIDIPAEISLNLPAGGSFAASGRQIYVAGDIGAPSGSITLKTLDRNAVPGAPYEQDAVYSNLVIANGASLSTSGVWVNDLLDGVLSVKPLALDGGKIVLDSAHDLDIQSGSRLAVDGGGQFTVKRALKKGNAGSITLSTGSGYGIYGLGNSLYLDGTLSGMALGKGGTLSITTSQLTLGAVPTVDTRSWSDAERLAADRQGYTATAGLVDRGGFYNFTFTGRTALTVAAGQVVKPDPLNWSLLNVGNYFRQRSGTDIAAFASTQVLPEALRSGTTSIKLTTTEYLSGQGLLSIGENAYVGVSTQGSVTLEAAGQMTVLGTLEAPGGTITLGRAAVSSGVGDSADNPAVLDAAIKQSESIYLGENSRLLAGGTVLLDADTQRALDSGLTADALLDRELYRGKVLAGGTVSLDAGLGYLIMREGALIDVSGTTGVLNAVAAADTETGYSYALRTVGSAGGTVSLAAHSGMFLDGRFKAQGGKDALGGSFSLRFMDTVGGLVNKPSWGVNALSFPELYAALAQGRALTLYQTAASTDKSGAENHVALWPAGVSEADYLAGSQLLDVFSYNGKTALDVALLQAGGFGSWYLTSQSDLRFAGRIEATVDNHLSLNAARFSAADDTASLALTAATARVGNFRTNAGAAQAASTGLASAAINARDIGLVGTFGWSGFGNTTFTSSGAIHFDSVANNVSQRTDGRTFNGQMTAAGALTFSAARLSPSTYSDYRIDLLADPGGSILITRPAGAVADVSLSPYGRLEFAANSIVHEGTIGAPLGEIVFSAPGGTVTLAAGSKTSVAADRDLLFGFTGESGSTWNYLEAIKSLPSKGVVIDAADSKVLSGAEIDLSGGGEALAWEFISGPGGTSDVLKASTTTFAIVPGWTGITATDAELQAGYTTNVTWTPATLKVGDAISLGKNSLGLSGSYVLLPARYAVLPGAYLVTVKSSGSDRVLAASEKQVDGSWLVAGSLTALNADGSSTGYAQTHLTLELANSELVAERAKYTLTTASSFFYDQQGARLAGDAARLAVAGRNSLVFDPSVIARTLAEISAADGRHRTAQALALDLAAPKLYVSNLASTPGGAAPDGYSVVDPSRLEGVSIASLLLGGVRTETTNGMQIETIASSVLINNDGNVAGGAALSAGEVLATASETVTVAGKSKIDSSGETTARDIALTGDGALLRVAEGSQVKVTRSSGVSRLNGDLRIGADAAVAGESLVFDATRGNDLAGNVSLGKRLDDGSRDGGGSIHIGAGRINVVADNSAPTEGVTLQQSDLNRFADAEQIRLLSYSTLDLYGNATLGSATLNELVLSAAGIAGHGEGSQARIAARQVTLENASPDGAQFVAGAAFGSGSLKVEGERIVLGDNATEAMRTAGTAGFRIAGYTALELAATGDVSFAGRGVTQIESGRVDINNRPVETRLDINAGRVTSTSGADHLLTATGDMSVLRNAQAVAPTTAAGMGSKLALGGKRIAVSGEIDLAAGDLTLAATGDVTLNAGALVSAAGAAKQFADTAAYASGGSITLKSSEGDVRVNQGAIATVSADAGGGNAGTIRLLAEKGEVDVAEHTLRGKAATGKTQGTLVVDAATVALDRLARAVVDPAGERHFGESWDIRRRVGDLALTEQIRAHNFKAAADAGNIDIYGGIDASGSKGGSIGLYANRARDLNGNAVGGRIDLHAGSVLKANATTAVTTAAGGTDGQGGSVVVSVSATEAADELDTAINFANGASIDVAVADGSIAKNGSVTFRVPRQDTVGNLKGTNGSAIDWNNVIAPNATGSATAYTLATSPAIGSYQTGMVVAFRAPAANTGALTLNVSSKGAKSVLRADGSALEASDIAANAVVVAVYDGTAFRVQTTTVSSTGSSSLMTVAPTTKALTANDIKLDGYTVTFRANAAATSSTRLTVSAVASGTNGSVTANLKRADGSSLQTNDIKLNQLVTVKYVVTNPNTNAGEFRLVSDMELASGAMTASVSAPVSLAGNIRGAATTAVEAVRTTRATGDYLIGSARQTLVLNSALQSAALAAANTLNAANRGGSLGNLVYRSGEEIRATGDITVGNDWSFSNTSAAGVVGTLTLRAEGDLQLSGTLSDGFEKSNVSADIYRDATVRSSGDSWSYQLVAGADTSAADSMQTSADATSGNLTLAANKLVRTGTGSIDLAASGDILLEDRSAVYTVGVLDTSAIDGFSANPGAGNRSPAAYFVLNGGDVSLTAGGSIAIEKPASGSPYQGHPNEWLMRVGGTRNLQWWARIASFQTGIAAFGGGDIRLTAGGDIVNPIVAVPTGGRVPSVDGVAQPDLAVITGGGDVAVQAGGSVQGGVIYAERGQIRVLADAIEPLQTAASSFDYTAFAIGNSTIDAVTRHDATIGTVFNPLWVKSKGWLYNNSYTSGSSPGGVTSPLISSVTSGDYSVRFGTYTDDSAVNLVSVAGNVDLKGSTAVLGIADDQTQSLLPGQVHVAALNGDIAGSVAQTPATSSQLDLLAAGSITLTGKGIQQLDIGETYLPSLRNPVLGNGPLGSVTEFILLDVLDTGSALEKHRAEGWHAGDTQASRLVALEGDIGGTTNIVSVFNEAVTVKAGGSINDLSLDIQHNNSSDASVIQAGGDILFSNKVETKNNAPATVPRIGIQVGGGGTLAVLAEGTIDLANTDGIVTRGNLDNPYLAEGGADILALAGATPDYAGLAAKLADSSVSVVNLIESGKTYKDAQIIRNERLQALHQKLKRGETLSETELLDLFFAKLVEYGRSAQNTGQKKTQYEAGRTLAAALFPESNVGRGDIKLSVSQIKTEQNGDIYLFAPGGSIVVGVAVPALPKAASEQGIFTINGGDINAWVRDNFLVNQSRVFTLNGGNIMIWADKGDIDAGSGAKTVNSTPPPVLVVRNGQIVLDTSNAVSGSGIGILASRDDTPASDMDLFAPEGAIDAGDAGLRSTGNITLGAEVILNATNIQAAGTVSGAPAPVTAAAPIAAVTTPTNNDNKAVEEAAQTAGKRDGAGGLLTVEVLDTEPTSSGAPAAEPSATPAKQAPAAKKDSEGKKDDQRKRKSGSAG